MNDETSAPDNGGGKPDLDAITQAVRLALAKEQAPPVELYKALALAKLEFDPIARDREVEVRKSEAKGGGFAYSFSYATLGNILSAVTGPLAKHGMVLIQRVVHPDGANYDYVETRLAHESGQSIFNLTRMIQTEEGQVGFAKAQTYSRRYGVSLLLCLAAEEDDDAQQPGERAVARDMDQRPQQDPDDPVLITGRQDSAIPADPEYVAEFAKRILALFDQQDPGGAFVLYQELNAAEQMLLWSKGGLTYKQKQALRDRGEVKAKPEPRGSKGRT